MPTTWQLLALCLVLCTCASGADNATILGKPLVIPPSQFWDGNDGPWSTFRIQVGGSAAQQVRVLPASGQSSTLLVLPEACTNANIGSGKECAEEHGGIYMRNASSTWREHGQYRLDTYLEDRIGVVADGLFGFDDLTLGWTGDGLPTLENQSIAGTISPSLSIGSLALNARPINFTDYNNPIPSLLQNLRNMTTPIPSLSWSYTAGAYNLAPKVFGSLVLGGYDTTRFQSNDLTFPFGADVSLDLQVAVQRITMSGTNDALLERPIISYISTLIPDIWLPLDSCTKFSKAFNLSFNTTSKEFYVNETMHETNLANNPIVAFQIGPEASGSSITINMPYWNFYLAGMTNGMFRFPIRHASNDTQYILGRAFLQSAYLSTDNDRKSFKLSQALYPSSSSKENIVAILPPGFSNGTTISDTPSKGLSTGAISGIAAGSAVGGVGLIAAIVLVCLYRRRKQARTKANELDDTELQNIIPHELAGDEKTYEMQTGAGQKHEMIGDTDPKIELSAGNETSKPVEAADTQAEIFEMPANEHKWVEMEGEGHLKEIG